MQLIIDSSQPLTATEKKILQVLLGSSAKTTDTTDAGPVAAAPVSEPVDEAPDAPTIEQVASVVGKILPKETGRERVKGILTELGVGKVRELPDDKLQQAMDMLTALKEELELKANA